MKLALTKIIKTIAVMLPGLALLSCSQDGINTPDTFIDTSGPMLGISLNVGKTRASESMNGGFVPGEGYENYLDIKNDDYRIYFFDIDNNYLAPFIISESKYPAGIDEALDYHFKGPLPQKVVNRSREKRLKFKLVVLANWGKNNYPTETIADNGKVTLTINGKLVDTIEELTTNAAAQFERLNTPGANEEWLSDSKLIPFYGVRSYDIESLVADKLDENGRLKEDVYVDLTKEELQLPLLRAMAKIEVILDKSLTSLASFSEVKLTKVNKAGFCAPYKKSVEGDTKPWKFDYTDYYNGVATDWDNNYTKGVHLTFGANEPEKKGEGTNDEEAESISLKKYPTDEKVIDGKTVVTPEKWVAYVPEYMNIDTDSFTTLEVTLNDPGADSKNKTKADESTEELPSMTKHIYFAVGCTEEANKTEDNRFNIERNNIYRFTITGMSANMKCAAEIIPYGEVNMEYTIGLERDKYGDIIVLSDPKTGEIDPYFWPVFYKKDDAGNYLTDASGKKVLNTDILPKYTVTDEAGEKHEVFLKRHPFPLVNEDAEPEHYPKENDYYALVLKEGKFEVWLKDEEGCRVLSNFAGTDKECHARIVEDFSTVPMQTIYKDIDGDSRLHHYENHATIILGDDNLKYYKSKLYDGEDPDGYDKPAEIVAKYLLNVWDQTEKVSLQNVTGSEIDNPNFNTCWYEVKAMLSNPSEADLKSMWKWPLYPWKDKGIDYAFPEEYKELVGKKEVIITTLQKVNAKGHRINEMKIKFGYKEETGGSEVVGDNNIKYLTEYYFVKKEFTIPSECTEIQALAYLTHAWRNLIAGTDRESETQLPTIYTGLAKPNTTIYITVSGPMTGINITLTDVKPADFGDDNTYKGF